MRSAVVAYNDLLAAKQQATEPDLSGLKTLEPDLSGLKATQENNKAAAAPVPTSVRSRTTFTVTSLACAAGMAFLYFCASSYCAVLFSFLINITHGVQVDVCTAWPCFTDGLLHVFTLYRVYVCLLVIGCYETLLAICVPCFSPRCMLQPANADDITLTYFSVFSKLALHVIFYCIAFVCRYHWTEGFSGACRIYD